MKGRTPRVPPCFKEIGEEQARKILRDGTPGLMCKYVGHDDSCPGAHGHPDRCNCTPTIEYYRIATPTRKARCN